MMLILLIFGSLVTSDAFLFRKAESSETENSRVVTDETPRQNGDARTEAPRQNGRPRSEDGKKFHLFPVAQSTNSSASHQNYPTPKCFTKRQQSTLAIFPFKATQNNESPKDCADQCLTIDPNDDRACKAFVFFEDTGNCKFFDKDSSDDIRIVEKLKRDLYEMQASCSKSKPKNSAASQHSKTAASHCFKKHESTTLASAHFKSKANNESPQDCANFCTQIHDDEDDSHTCHGFDYNLKTGGCRFFEKSPQYDNVKTTDSVKRDFYEMDEHCYRAETGPATLPPHVEACPKGTKPLMEKVTGWYLKSAGLAFKGVSEEKCSESCLKDRLASREENYKCLSVSYNNSTRTCVYLSEIASPLNRKGQSLRQDRRYNYYAKMCMSSDVINKCKGYVTRFASRTLVGMNDGQLTTKTYPDCVKACLNAKEKMGFTCMSGMFFNNSTNNNCLLNYADHYTEPDLFIDEPDTIVDYFSIKSCQW